MNISVDVSSLIVDGEIRDWGKGKNYLTSELCIQTCDGDFIFLKFKSPELLTDFCKKHNFPLEDKRNASN